MTHSADVATVAKWAGQSGWLYLSARLATLGACCGGCETESCKCCAGRSRAVGRTKRADEQWQKIIEMADELGTLKANNRYQRGHTDGYTEALAKVQDQVLKMRV